MKKINNWIIRTFGLRGSKRGENFGIKLVKVLPKIHKISLDMIAKDIFRSENK